MSRWLTTTPRASGAGRDALATSALVMVRSGEARIIAASQAFSGMVGPANDQERCLAFRIAGD